MHKRRIKSDLMFEQGKTHTIDFVSHMESGTDAVLSTPAGTLFDGSEGGAVTTGELPQIEEDVAQGR